MTLLTVLVHIPEVALFTLLFIKMCEKNDNTSLANYLSGKCI